MGAESLNSLSLSTKNREVPPARRWLLGWRGWQPAKAGLGASVPGVGWPGLPHDSLTRGHGACAQGQCRGSRGLLACMQGLGVRSGPTGHPLLSTGGTGSLEPEALRGSLVGRLGDLPRVGAGAPGHCLRPGTSSERAAGRSWRARKTLWCQSVHRGRVQDLHREPAVWEVLLVEGTALESSSSVEG